MVPKKNWGLPACLSVSQKEFPNCELEIVIQAVSNRPSGQGRYCNAFIEDSAVTDVTIFALYHF
jgi:hypothetical protein